MHPYREVRLWHKGRVATSSWTLEPRLITLASEKIHGKQLSRLLSSGCFSEGKGLSGWHCRLICDRRYHFTLTMGPKAHSSNTNPSPQSGTQLPTHTHLPQVSQPLGYSKDANGFMELPNIPSMLQKSNCSPKMRHSPHHPIYTSLTWARSSRAPASGPLHCLLITYLNWWEKEYIQDFPVRLRMPPLHRWFLEKGPRLRGTLGDPYIGGTEISSVPFLL
jgi:hypothetical protein